MHQPGRPVLHRRKARTGVRRLSHCRLHTPHLTPLCHLRCKHPPVFCVTGYCSRIRYSYNPVRWNEHTLPTCCTCHGHGQHTPRACISSRCVGLTGPATSCGPSMHVSECTTQSTARAVCNHTSKDPLPPPRTQRHSGPRSRPPHKLAGRRVDNDRLSLLHERRHHHRRAGVHDGGLATSRR